MRRTRGIAAVIEARVDGVALGQLKAAGVADDVRAVDAGFGGRVDDHQHVAVVALHPGAFDELE